jgi:hypothetical protein
MPDLQPADLALDDEEHRATADVEDTWEEFEDNAEPEDPALAKAIAGARKEHVGRATTGTTARCQRKSDRDDLGEPCHTSRPTTASVPVRVPSLAQSETSPRTQSPRRNPVC